MKETEVQFNFLLDGIWGRGAVGCSGGPTVLAGITDAAECGPEDVEVLFDLV